MEQHADLGRLRRSELIGGIVYWPLFLFGVPLLAVLAVKYLWLPQSEAQAQARANFVYGLINAAALALLFRRYLQEQFLRLQARGWRLFADVGIGYLQYYFLAYLTSIVISLLTRFFGLGSVANANQEAVEAAAHSVPVLAILDACLLAPLAEELLTRGLIFSGLCRRSRFWAYALSMAVFALAHCAASMFHQPVSVTLINFLTYLPAGFLLARVYERTGSIWTSILLHGVINAVSLAMLALLR